MLQTIPHIVGLYPLYRDIDSLVVKVSKLIHLHPVREILGIRTCSLELVE